MFRLIEKLTRLSRKETAKDDAIDALLNREFSGLREVDAETQNQWLRLQRTLSQQEIGAAKPTRRLVPRLAFGTAIVATALIGTYFYFAPGQLSADTFTTGRGERQLVTLADSSEVTLNYATELAVEKLQQGKPRLLSLKGEAFFRVRHNETPFVVTTEFAEVQVIGTEFNVRVRDGMLEVAVLRGVVKVNAIRDGKDSAIVLTRNEMVLCTVDNFPEKIGNVPFPEYPGWLNGKLFLNKTTLAEACREIEMRFDTAIRIDDGKLRKEMVTGTLEARSAETALGSLCELTGKKFMHDGQEFVIY